MVSVKKFHSCTAPLSSIIPATVGSSANLEYTPIFLSHNRHRHVSSERERERETNNQARTIKRTCNEHTVGTVGFSKKMDALRGEARRLQTILFRLETLKKGRRSKTEECSIYFSTGSWRIERRLNYSWFARRETRLTRKPQYDYQQETHVPRFVIDSNVFSFFSLSFPTNKKRKITGR